MKEMQAVEMLKELYESSMRKNKKLHVKMKEMQAIEMLKELNEYSMRKNKKLQMKMKSERHFMEN